MVEEYPFATLYASILAVFDLDEDGGDPDESIGI
jgi:hypothetical protein